MRKISKIILVFGLAAGGLATLAACGGSAPQNVSPQEFYSRRSPTPSPIPVLDQPGALPSVPDERVAPIPPPPQQSSGPVNIPPGGFNESIYQTLPPIQTLPRTFPSAIASASTMPSTQPSIASVSSTQPAYAENQYMTLGGVVAVVNGTPIYANKVLRLVTPILRQYAHEYDFYDFEGYARSAIDEQVHILCNDEIYVAAAERSLDPKQIDIARALTEIWRKNQIAEAGGSEQVAVARAEYAAPGENFQDLEQDQYRRYLWLIYKAYKIDPAIEFTAEQERQFYNANINLFTTPTKATIILIEADPGRIGNDAKAKARLEDIRQRALAGEDFANYAHQQNDLPGAAGPQGTGGLLTDVKPNSLVFTKVDAEIWKLPIGQISNVIADNGAYYIFKLVSRQDGQTAAFADQKVQEYIKQRLSALALSQHQEAETAKLEQEGIGGSPDPNAVDVVVDMAMQNYPVWRKEKAPGIRPYVQTPTPQSNPSPQ